MSTAPTSPVGREGTPPSGSLALVSTGPGFRDWIPPAARQALESSDAVVGYERYFTWIRPWLAGKELYSIPLTREIERAETAIRLAREGRQVSLISSGDIGVYGMAPVVLERLRPREPFALRILPGVSAANSSASLLGAPLAHDFATLSLSDRLCPWEWIETRARKMAEADLVVALYNVQSAGRPQGVYTILRRFLEHKGPKTWCGVVGNAYREGQQTHVARLADLLERQYDMLTTIIVGNRFTCFRHGYLYTPRGYHGWEAPAEETAGEPAAATNPHREGPAASPINLQQSDDPLLAHATGSPTAGPMDGPLWVFTGTHDGNALAAELARQGYSMIVSAASPYGQARIREAVPEARVAGRLGRDGRLKALRQSKAAAIIDATHPFATGISTQLMELAEATGIPYIRYERPSIASHPQAIQVAGPEQAAREAIARGSRTFLATGSKDLERLVNASGDHAHRWFVRVAPEPESIARALDLGIPHSQICAMQGPFSSPFNRVLWESWQIDSVVTKESGTAGGFDAKAEAAESLDIPLIVIRRPRVPYPCVAASFSAVLNRLQSLFANPANG